MTRHRHSQGCYEEPQAPVHFGRNWVLIAAAVVLLAGCAVVLTAVLS